MEKLFPRCGKLLLSLLLCASAASAANLDWAGWAKNTADNGILAPSQDLIVVVDSKPLGGATNVQVRFAVDGGDEPSRAMEHHGTANYDTHDRWKVNLGKFPEGAAIRLFHRGDRNQPNPRHRSRPGHRPQRGGGHPLDRQPAHRPETRRAESGERPARVFRHVSAPAWPSRRRWAIPSTTAPPGKPSPCPAAIPPTATMHGPRTSARFPEGAGIRFYVRARNADGQSFWDSNTGADYRLRVNSPIRDVTLDKGRYNPGETAQHPVDLNNPGRRHQRHADRPRAEPRAKSSPPCNARVSLPTGTRAQSAVFPWKTPTNDFRGYGVDVDLVVDGQVRDSRSSAIDVSSDWTRFPRMGFFSEYPAGDDAQGQAAELVQVPPQRRPVL